MYELRKQLKENLATANRTMHIWILNWENSERMLRWGRICTVFPPALTSKR